MPHIKVARFDTSTLINLDFVEFLGVSKRGIKVVGVKSQKTISILIIKETEDEVIIKPDKISRPVDVEEIKETLFKIKNRLSLETRHSNITLSSKKPKAHEEYNKSIKDFIDFDAKGFDEVALEVGFGSGRHLLYQAKNNPSKLFIGIEIHTPSAMQVLKQIRLQNLKNIWIINYDARLLLEILPSNILSNIYVHFPVPWDKKPHRRVINREFLSEAMRVLKVDGKLELRTDSPNYYFYSLEIFSSPKKVDFRVQKNRDLEIISKYEARWRRQNKDIYTLTLNNALESPPKGGACSFEFGKASKEKVVNLQTQKQLFDSSFLTIKEIYTLKNRDGYLLEVAFGSFDRPEHKYILIDEKKIQYLPDIPVPTQANCKAHQRLKEILCQM